MSLPRHCPQVFKTEHSLTGFNQVRALLPVHSIAKSLADQLGVADYDDNSDSTVRLLSAL